MGTYRWDTTPDVIGDIESYIQESLNQKLVIEPPYLWIGKCWGCDRIIKVFPYRSWFKSWQPTRCKCGKVYTAVRDSSYFWLVVFDSGKVTELIQG
jgi:hypothetical protein